MSTILISLAKALFRATLTETVRRGLPEIYRRLDSEVPLFLLNNAPPSKINGIIGSAIADVSGRRATNEQIAAVIGLYDPVRAAIRRSR